MSTGPAIQRSRPSALELKVTTGPQERMFDLVAAARRFLFRYLTMQLRVES